MRITTLGGKGSRVESKGHSTIAIGVPTITKIEDPTGVGDSYRAGFIAGLAWGVSLERCAQLGAILAAFCLETKGTQEYRFDKGEFLARFGNTFGASAAGEISSKL